MPVAFFFADTSATLTNRTQLKIFIESLFKKEGFKLASLTYVFCCDEYLLGINKSFLQHDFYTDIITFDLSESAKETTGEIYISIDRVKENADTHNVSIKEELHRVIFHGALHLCGYKDKSQGDALKMRAAEDSWLKKYFN